MEYFFQQQAGSDFLIMETPQMKGQYPRGAGGAGASNWMQRRRGFQKVERTMNGRDVLRQS